MIGKKNLSGILVAIACVVTIFSVCAFVPRVWVCDLLSQFRLVHFLVLIACALLLGLLRNKWGAAFCLISFLVNSIPIIPMWFQPGCSASNKLNAPSLSVLNFNTEFQHNKSYSLFEQLIKRRHPDLIALVEVDQPWIDAISDCLKDYPYRKVVMAGAGMAIFSKYPLLDVKVEYFGASQHPRISSNLQFRDRLIYLMVVHPTTPRSNPAYRERDDELSLVAEEMAASRGTHLLIGDFNCGPWAAAFQRLLNTGMHDSEKGFGPQPSRPARTGRVVDNISVPPIIPIDHVLVSRDICVLERQAGPSLHSDHLPVFARLQFDENSNSSQRK